MAAAEGDEVIVTDEQASTVNHRVVRQGTRVLRGYDAELAQKHLDNWDPELERRALDWVEQMTGEKVTSVADLKSGKVLCQLANRIKPNVIPRWNQGQNLTPLHQRDNIRLYIDACIRIGVPSSEVFMVEDLFEEKFLPGVLKNLFSLGRLLQLRSSWYGPKLQAIRLPSWMQQPAQDSMEHLVRQAAEIVQLPPLDLEKALNALAAERVRTRAQLQLLRDHTPYWHALSLPPALKAEIQRMLPPSTRHGTAGRQWLLAMVLGAGVAAAGYWCWRKGLAVPPGLRAASGTAVARLRTILGSAAT